MTFVDKIQEAREALLRAYDHPGARRDEREEMSRMDLVLAGILHVRLEGVQIRNATPTCDAPPPPMHHD